MLGFTVIDEPDMPLFHANDVPAMVLVTLILVDSPLHKTGSLDEIESTGLGFTMIVVCAEAEHP